MLRIPPHLGSCPVLDRKAFLHVVQHAPLISMDLLVPHQNQLLMGRRINEPARGSWFVPGGRIRKNETLEHAFERLCQAELGLTLALDQARLAGAFTHHYDSNFADAPGITTHYVVLAYQLPRGCLDPALTTLPPDQHDSYAWIGPQHEDLPVHPNSGAYFDVLSPSP